MSGRVPTAGGRPDDPSHPIRVLCVDDSFLVAEGLAMVFRKASGFEWVGQVPEAANLEAEVDRLQPDVILLDVDLPGRSAFEALNAVRRMHPGTRTIVFTGYVQPEFIDRAVECGAWGFLAKGGNPERVVHAVRRVTSGEFVLSDDAAEIYKKWSCTQLPHHTLPPHTAPSHQHTSA